MTWDPQKAELAAGDAEVELGEMSDSVVRPFVAWYVKYYMDAGHRRLGRILVSISKENAEQERKKKSSKKTS